MEKNDYKKLNEIMEDYINYLARYNYIFLYNAEFFHQLTTNYEEFEISSDEHNYQKINATNSFKLVKEFYLKFYPEEIEKLEQLFNSGVFEIYYIDELYEEKLYLTKEDILFRQGKKDGHSFIKLPLTGDIRDIHLIIHEIRHQLNEPDENRDIDNDTLTETLSMFDEILALDYFKDRLTEDTYKKLKKYYFHNFYKLFNNVNFITELIMVKRILGEISIENYKMLFDKVNEDALEYDLKKFLNTHESYHSIDAHIQNWYVFGLFLISFMHQEYQKDTKYLDKVKQFNESVKNNGYINDCLKLVDIDLTDDDIIDKLRKSLKSEINDIKENVKTV